MTTTFRLSAGSSFKTTVRPFATCTEPPPSPDSTSSPLDVKLDTV
eukprot:CAMPEP_0177778632 /NCGR_PEP_ID=MMETSP0491_2-20121128/16067_1 /TAXON_ID=63592 /ORGANISM="Tetraselmis chuii, Strain PLY429" /LENGTH=44 /DNA_ID= /DNA_START= /DNA_END= /DNA_ORIENTATION=